MEYACCNYDWCQNSLCPENLLINQRYVHSLQAVSETNKSTIMYAIRRSREPSLTNNGNWDLSSHPSMTVWRMIKSSVISNFSLFFFPSIYFSLSLCLSFSFTFSRSVCVRRQQTSLSSCFIVLQADSKARLQDIRSLRGPALHTRRDLHVGKLLPRALIGWGEGPCQGTGTIRRLRDKGDKRGRL